MVFLFSRFSFVPFWPHLSYTARSLLELSTVKSLMPNWVSFHWAPIFCYLSSSSAPVILPTQFSLYSLLSLSLCYPPLTCNLFSFSSRLVSLLHTSSNLSWDNTKGALMLLSSSSFVPSPSFSQELSFSTSAPLSEVWFSPVDTKSQFNVSCVARDRVTFNTSISLNLRLPGDYN